MEKATKYKASAERYWFAEFEKIGLKYHPPMEGSEDADEELDEKANQKEQLPHEDNAAAEEISRRQSEGFRFRASDCPDDPEGLCRLVPA